MNRDVRFLLLGDFRQLPAVQDAFGGAPVLRNLKETQLLHDLAGGCVHELRQNQRSDEGIFSFLEWLKVDEAEQVELWGAVQRARELFARRGLPDTCLVISHTRTPSTTQKKPQAGALGRRAAGAPRVGPGGDQPAADHARLAGAEARRRRREGGQGPLRRGPGGGGAVRARRRTELLGA